MPNVTPKKHKVVHVLPQYGIGGVEITLSRMISSFDVEYEQSIISLSTIDNVYPKIPTETNIHLKSAPASIGLLRKIVFNFKYLKQSKPDLLLTYNWGSISAIIAAKILRIKNIIHHESGFNLGVDSYNLKRRIWGRRLLYRMVKYVIVPSKTMQQVAIEKWWLPTKSIKFIPNGVTYDKFNVLSKQNKNSLGIRNRLHLTEDDILVGFVGRLCVEKNILRLVETISLLSHRNVYLLLIGDGPERLRIEAKINQLNLNKQIKIIGFKSEHELPYYYLALDIFILGSDTEQMPISILEAMSFGLPIIATDVGDIKQMLPERQKKYIVIPKAKSLAQALDELITSPDQVVALGQANSQWVRQHYTLDAMIQAYKHLYQLVLTS